MSSSTSAKQRCLGYLVPWTMSWVDPSLLDWVTCLGRKTRLNIMIFSTIYDCSDSISFVFSSLTKSIGQFSVILTKLLEAEREGNLLQFNCLLPSLIRSYFYYSKNNILFNLKNTIKIQAWSIYFWPVINQNLSQNWKILVNEDICHYVLCKIFSLFRTLLEEIMKDCKRWKKKLFGLLPRNFLNVRTFLNGFWKFSNPSKNEFNTTF